MLHLPCHMTKFASLILVAFFFIFLNFHCNLQNQCSVTVFSKFVVGVVVVVVEGGILLLSLHTPLLAQNLVLLEAGSVISLCSSHRHLLFQAENEKKKNCNNFTKTF